MADDDTAGPCPGDLFNPDCPTRLVLDRIADKWTVMLLVLLSRGPWRFGALRRATGISQKVLAQALRRLERDGLVSRRVFATMPVTVEYAITPLGTDLARALETLRHWAEAHIGEVLAAQRRYDSAEEAALPAQNGAISATERNSAIGAVAARASGRA